ncbi:MAG: retroviral-like aspartic protease family protein [Anaerolineae bacterium]|nr:retroviral-like aspartic protease family protein [Anaerolineae bacterium]
MSVRRYRLFRQGYLLVLHSAIGGDRQPRVVRMILDTGAGYTMLPPEILEAVGCDLRHPAREVNILTVQGIVTAPVVVVPWFHCLGRRVSQWPVVAHSLPSGLREYAVGLLGMDFLTRFQAVIDVGKGEIWLEGAPDTGELQGG